MLQAACADGDALLCLNVPPTWSEAAGFAAARPGVLWHCHQVEPQQQQPEHGGSWRSREAATSRSWAVDGHDLYGRTLPAASYGSSVPTGSNFVGQDNTRKVAHERSSYAAEDSSSSSSSSRWCSTSTHSSSSSSSSSSEANWQDAAPASFTIRHGTMLSDAAACGDVEAVFGGRAAVTLLQTWPAGHPLSLRDELLLAALDEGPGGLPAWLADDA
jgi:hypothetical protein